MEFIFRIINGCVLEVTIVMKIHIVVLCLMKPFSLVGKFHRFKNLCHPLKVLSTAN